MRNWAKLKLLNGRLLFEELPLQQCHLDAPLFAPTKLTILCQGFLAPF